ncbi:MAG: DUF3575 domain-containing protein [Bacteroidales bacterium]|nr:DUF3575 domain-containing protein [Bacteroidales bacterium]
MKARITTLLIACVLAVGSLGAQNRWALKTNILHDATASVNLALEYSFSPHWSIELSGSGNYWALGEVNLKHLIVQPELRYWLCDRFNGWFLNAHAIGGYIPAFGGFWDFSQYYSRFPNLRTFFLRHAIVIGGGVGVGYDIILGRHWNLELEMGLGYMYVKGGEYFNQRFLQESVFDYVGPTRVGVTIVYLF